MLLSFFKKIYPRRQCNTPMLHNGHKTGRSFKKRVSLSEKQIQNMYSEHLHLKTHNFNEIFRNENKGPKLNYAELSNQIHPERDSRTE